MTLPFKNSRKVVVNTGAVTEIDVDFPAEASQYVKVYAGLPGALLMVQGVDYTLTGVAPGSSDFTVNITDPGGWTDYSVFAVSVEYTVEQPSDVDVGGPFGLRFENALDRLALIMQSLEDRVNRSLKTPVTGVVGQDNSITAYPGQLIGWDEDGEELVGYPTVTQSTQEAIAAAIDANEAADDAVLAAILAEAWANTAEDTDVPGAAPGSRSAFHWMRKALLQAAAAAASAASAAAAALGVINAAAADDTIADTDNVLYLSGTDLKKGTFAGLITSLFNGTRKVANVIVDATNFKIRNTGGFDLTFNTAGLTASRDQTWQDKAGTVAHVADNNVKAWVNFNGVGTVAVRGSKGVTSITDNGTGDYTVNFSTPMSSLNYAAALSAAAGSGTIITAQERLAGASTFDRTASSFRMLIGVPTVGFVDAFSVNAIFVE